ncbi:MAG: hypothetical protein R3E01_11275 [Pirellulaceae bacterium]|nr:hypothetical protein [Planctomycetales bacterium]
MDPLHFAIAVIPVALYLFFAGLINLLPRASVVSGYVDTWGLALGLVGLVVAGPMELFMPEATAFRFGPIVWILLLALYLLCITLIVLTMRPRIVVYNIPREQLWQILQQVAGELDPQVRFAGNAVSLPNLGVDAHLDDFVAMRNIQLVANSQRQDPRGWAMFEKAIRSALRGTKTGPSPNGFGLITFALVFAVAVGLALVRHPQEIAQSLHEMLRF